MADDDDSNDSNDSELDFLSPNFNPRTALYAERVSIPYPDAKEFVSIGEYGEFILDKIKEKREAEMAAALDEADKIKFARLAKEKQISDERRKPPLPITTDKSGGAAKVNVPRKTNRHRATIFTRMTELHCRGPFSLLKKCMDENRLVKVIVRNAHSVRGFCRGYILAFDNHYNLAMRDVDEVYQNPLWTSRSGRRRNKKRLEAQEKTKAANLLANEQNKAANLQYRERVPIIGSDSEEDEPPEIITTVMESDEPMTFTPQSRTLKRHLNQMMIKGDNIVVVIAGEGVREKSQDKNADGKMLGVINEEDKSSDDTSDENKSDRDKGNKSDKAKGNKSDKAKGNKSGKAKGNKFYEQNKTDDQKLNKSDENQSSDGGIT